MTCEEFKIICIRMAHALGYHETVVRDSFGSIKDRNLEKDKKQLKLLFD
jgi:D-aminopeptidase